MLAAGRAHLNTSSNQAPDTILRLSEIITAKFARHLCCQEYQAAGPDGAFQSETGSESRVIGKGGHLVPSDEPVCAYLYPGIQGRGKPLVLTIFVINKDHLFGFEEPSLGTLAH